MIKLENISYSYGKAPFFEGINVGFEKGRLTAVIGPNGCGKSTMIKLASGLLEPKRGKVLLEGQDIKNIKRKELAKKVAVLSQGNHPSHMVAEDIVMAGRYPYQSFAKGYSKEDRDIRDYAMKITGSEYLRGKEVYKLSGGERQKIFIAMALAQDTDIIFLDEPTTYLDISVGYEIMDLIAKLNSEMKKTIIMVLHDLSLVLNYSQNAVLMNMGRIAAEGTTEILFKSNYLNTIFNIKTKCFIEDNKKYYCFDKA